jgi:hypothetical protein
VAYYYRLNKIKYMKKSVLTIILFTFLFSSCDPMATATICNKSKHEIFVFIEFDKNYLLERTDLTERDMVRLDLPAIEVDTLNLRGKYKIMPDSCCVLDFNRGYEVWFHRFSKLTIISGIDTLKLKSKKEIKEAFKEEEDGYYLKIKSRH